jgi:hypothetical protein
MRLLNSATMQMKEFISDEIVPKYAILSHTWGDEELTFALWESLPLRELIEMKGYRKIQYVCEQAQKDGYEYAWVDT